MFPSQVEAEVLRVDGLTPHFQIEVDRSANLAKLTVRVERNPSGRRPGLDLADELAGHIKGNIGVTAEVVIAEPGAVPRSAGKAQRSSGPRMRDIAAAVGRWSDAPDISARSVLVTVLGDSVLPVTKTVWLSSLFELARPFGFSERLVRTSLFRLAAEDWVSNERVGRRSRYSLTRLAVSEFEDADRRIYSHTPFEWDGWWTIAIVDSPLTPAAERERIIRHLRWHGFVALGRGLLASPSVMPQSLHQLLELIEFSGVVPAGRGRTGRCRRPGGQWLLRRGLPHVRDRVGVQELHREIPALARRGARRVRSIPSTPSRCAPC